MRSWVNGAGLAALLLGCGASAGLPDGDRTGAPPADAPAAASGGGAGGASAPASVVPGFADTPVVRFREDATNESVDRSCRELSREISLDEARDLGFEVDADRAVLERSWSSAVEESRDPVRTSTLHLRSRIDRVLSVERTPRSPEVAAALCPSTVVYEVVVELYTEDGTLSGAFVARSRAMPAGESPVRHLEANADLRNFSGDLPVAWNGSSDLFATAEIVWSFEEGAAEAFYFRPRVWYSMRGYPEFLSYGVLTGEAGAFADLLADLGGYIPDPAVSTLGEFAAAMGRYSPNVGVRVVARSAVSTQVRVSARVNGADVPAATLELTGDWRQQVADGFTGGTLDLGPIEEGAQVEIEVQDIQDLGDVQANILVGSCPFTPAYDRCREPGCTTRSALSVVTAACDPVIDD